MGKRQRCPGSCSEELTTHGEIPRSGAWSALPTSSGALQPFFHRFFDARIGKSRICTSTLRRACPLSHSPRESPYSRSTNELAAKLFSWFFFFFFFFLSPRFFLGCKILMIGGISRIGEIGPQVLVLNAQRNRFQGVLRAADCTGTSLWATPLSGSRGRVEHIVGGYQKNNISSWVNQWLSLSVYFLWELIGCPTGVLPGSYESDPSSLLLDPNGNVSSYWSTDLRVLVVSGSLYPPSSS